jgi:hypothetical protein
VQPTKALPDPAAQRLNRPHVGFFYIGSLPDAGLQLACVRKLMKDKGLTERRAFEARFLLMEWQV